MADVDDSMDASFDFTDDDDQFDASFDENSPVVAKGKVRARGGERGTRTGGRWALDDAAAARPRGSADARERWTDDTRRVRCAEEDGRRHGETARKRDE